MARNPNDRLSPDMLKGKQTAGEKKYRKTPTRSQRQKVGEKLRALTRNQPTPNVQKGNKRQTTL